MTIELWGQNRERRQLERRVGSMRQLAGLRQVVLDDGRARSVRCVEVRTGSGLAYQVVVDRGMDIGLADFQGVPLCWVSSVGEVHPAYYEPTGLGWLRSFGGGLEVTGGLTQVGNPCVDGDEELGLHGRISNSPATHLALDEGWQEDRYVLSVSGQVRETSVFGADLVMTRRITSELGGTTISIEDVVENRGANRTPHMHLYHCNFGFPIVDDGSELVLPSLHTVPRDDVASSGLQSARHFSDPQAGFKEQVFYHEARADASGYVTAAIVNRRLRGGMAIAVRYRQAELPELTEWKMMGEQTYVVGLEPGNCRVEGRVAERAAGRLKYLEPGARQSLHIEINVISGEQSVQRLVDTVLG